MPRIRTRRPAATFGGAWRARPGWWLAFAIAPGGTMQLAWESANKGKTSKGKEMKVKS